MWCLEYRTNARVLQGLSIHHDHPFGRAQLVQCTLRNLVRRAQSKSDKVADDPPCDVSIMPGPAQASEPSAAGSSTSLSAKSIPLPYPVEERQLYGGDVVKMLPSSLSHSLESSESQTAATRKGRNVSGRSWKVRPQRKATTLVSSRANGRCKDWSSRVAERGERRQLLDLQKEIRQAKEDEARLKRERRLENETRRQENELRNLEKSKAVKALNHGKAHLTIKAMNKKQLRQIKKSRLNPRTGVVEYVSAYAK